jgi:hypothetical protein
MSFINKTTLIQKLGHEPIKGLNINTTIVPALKNIALSPFFISFEAIAPTRTINVVNEKGFTKTTFTSV